MTLCDKIIGKKDCIEKYITSLDSAYANNYLTDAWIKYKKFVDVKRGDRQPIKEFIADNERNKLKQR